MFTVAVLGAKGYVGSAISAALSRNSACTVSKVTRENYVEMAKQRFDIVINSAMPSGRFWARNNPREDFVETVQKTADIFYGWQFTKFVQVSTISARCQLGTVYGRHKAAAEKLCDFGENLILRLGPMYSAELKKGVLVDIVRGKRVFAAGESRYCFAPLEFVSDWIVSHLDRSGVVEVGAKNAITLREIAEHMRTNVEFDGAVDHQEIKNPEPSFPDAYAVLEFLDSWKMPVQST